MKHLYFTLIFIVCCVNFSRAQDEFIFTWQATDAQKELSTPTSGTGYDYTIDWGDGTIETNLNGFRSHTYTSNGTYTITIQGTFPAIAFGNNPDFRVPAQLVSIEQWGTNMWTDMTRAFSGCSNVVINATDRPNLSNTTSLEKMFDGTTNLVDNGGELGNWDVSTIENMADMFRNSGMNVNIGSWNVGNVINFIGMFTGNTAFNQNISGWNIGEFVSGSINMRAMFDSASSFNSPLNAWDMSKVTNVSSMFGFATAFNQPLDNWNTSSVENMGGMFFGASDFDQNVGDWNLSSVTAMGAMFQLAGLSTTNYDTTLIGWATQDPGETIPSNISISFEGSQYCFGAEARNILTDNTGLNWNISDDGAACDLTEAFITTWQTTTANEGITIPTTGSGYNYVVDWGDGTIEEGFTGNATHEYATAGIYTVKIIGDFPRIFFNNGGSKNKILSVEQWGAIAWESMVRAFRGCTNLKLTATDLPNLSAVTNATRMFESTSNFEDLGGVIGQWDTGNITIMNGMFQSSGFNTDIGDWDVSKVTDFDGMFYVCPNFDQDLGNWDISEAVTMRSFITTNSLATNNFSLENYDKTLKGWATLDAGETRIPRDVVLSVDLTRYCDAFVEHDQLVNDYNWRISDLGLGCPEDEKFIATWETTTANEMITIPTFSGESYRYVIEWGDNTTEVVTTDTAPTHTYTNARTYTVKITGDFPRIYFGGSTTTNARLIQSIEQWGSNKWTSMESAFKGCVFLEINATDVPDLSDATSMVSMFEDGTCIDNGGSIGSWNVSTIIAMDNMFRNAFMEENINSWNVSSVKTMNYMFSGCEDFNQPLDQWNTSNLESAIEAFSDTKSFDQSLADWNISNVSDFTDIFRGTSSFSDENYDKTLIGWATLEGGETLSLGVTFGAGDLRYCVGENARNILTGAPYNWNITDGGLNCNFGNAFTTTWQTTVDNESITIPTNGSGYTYAIDWGDGTIENGLTGNATHTYAIAGTHSVKIIGNFPRIYFNNSGDKEKIRSIERWGNIEWVSMDQAFSGCVNLKLNATDTPNLSGANSAIGMFNGCTNLEDLQNTINDWDISTIINISNMFEGCTLFNEDISNWDVTNVFFMDSTFAAATSFNQDINSWDTSNIVFMRNTFNGATAFDQSLADWDLSGIQFFMTDMLVNSGLSQANYDATLIGWATLDPDETKIPNDVRFATNANFCTAEAARNTLTSGPNNWRINDGGFACDFTGAFITTWQTTTANEVITIPTKSTETYNYIIDWGDGTVETGLIGDSTHAFVTPGIQTIKITGDFPAPFFTRLVSDDEGKLLTIEQWGTQQWTSMQSAFQDCYNLKLNADDIPDLSQVTRMSSMFRDCTNLEDLKDVMNSWDMNTIESISSMFKGCTLFDENIGSWTFNSLTAAFNAFEGAAAFNQNISNWDVSKVDQLDAMFKDATSFNQPIGNWTLGVVDYIDRMFQGATAFNQDLSNWDFSNVYDAGNMFEGASSFDQDLSSWDISNVESLDNFFIGSGISQENYDKTLIGWATLEAGETTIPADLTLDATVAHCVSANAVNTLTSAPYNWTINDLGNACPEDPFITTWQTNTDNESITIPTNGSGYDYIVDWGDGTIETGFTANATHEYTTAGTYTVKITGDFPRIRFNFSGADNRSKIQTIEQWGTQQWDTFSSGFDGCVNLKLNAEDTPDLSQATKLSSMFESCTNFEDLKDRMGSWDVSTIEGINSMFTGCSIFDEDISGWTFTNLIRTDSAFEEALAFNQNISNWNMTTVTDMAYMFYNAAAFNQPVGNWTLGTVEYMTGMFYGATTFNQDLSSWDFSQVQDIEELFSGASSFNQDLSSWDISSVTNMTGIFTGTGLSQENYDHILVGWATLEAAETAIPGNLTLDADATYCLGEAARNTLTSAPYNWTINDGGQGCIAPVITLLGDNPQIIELGDNYVELGAEVTYGATLTINATSVNTNQVGRYTVTYDAINNVSGVSAPQVIRTVDVVDTTAPVITLVGDNPQEIVLGAGYTELGATTDDSSTVVINATDFVDAVGSYTIRYNATDASGNRAMEVTRTVNVVDTCPLSNIPANNFTITTTSETCEAKDNGTLTITTATALAYRTTINGVDHSFTSSLAIDNLPPGTYPICITVEGFANCEQCFEAVIAAAEFLSGATSVENDTTGTKMQVEIATGTPPYTVTINDEVIGTFANNSFTVDVNHGDQVAVSSSLECEGKLSSKVNLFDSFRIAPNPTRGDVTLSVPDSVSGAMNISIYNAIGVIVSSGMYDMSSGQVVLPTANLPQGIYLISIADGGTFKMVKQ